MRQLAYISEQTDMSEMNTLQAVSIDVLKNNVATADGMSDISDCEASPYVKHHKTVFHPGEVNRIRELPQHPNMVITHTDSPDVYVWDMSKQKDRSQEEARLTSSAEYSISDLVLKGHSGDAEYALGCSTAEPLVASGGKDTNVLVWDLRGQPPISGEAGQASVLHPKHTLRGHANTVEDICWSPGSANLLASVGDDHKMLLWDLRSSAPCVIVDDAHGHGVDIHCVDWSPLEPHLIASACAEGILKIWDNRKLNTSGAGNKDSALKTIKHHNSAVMRVEWCHGKPGVVATGSEDRLVCVWSLNQPSPAATCGAPQAGVHQIPAELLFQHAGHQAPVVDFQWNPCDPWCMLSASDGAAAGSTGGTMQIWRMLDFIYRDPSEVKAELEVHRDYILHGHGGPETGNGHAI